MTRRRAMLVGAAGLWLALVSACGSTSQQGEAARPGDEGAHAAPLAWLAGTWVADGDTLSEERWAQVEDGLVGVSRTVADGQVVHHELLRIRPSASGTVYVASPAGQPTTELALTEHTDQRAVFENPEHDYPKRILYQRDGDTLVARIEGAPGDRTAEWRFEHLGPPPRVQPLSARVCIGDSGGTITLPECACAAEVYCAVARQGDRIAPTVAMLDRTCDACTTPRGPCTVEPRDAAGGLPLPPDDGSPDRCATGEVPVLVAIIE